MGKRTLNRIRVVNSYLLVFATLIIAQKYTIGLIPGFRDATVFNLFYVKEIVFTVVAILFIKAFVRIGVPTGQK